MRIDEALGEGYQYDALGSLIVWLCKKSEVNAMIMPGKRYDIGNMKSYEFVKKRFCEDYSYGN